MHSTILNNLTNNTKNTDIKHKISRLQEQNLAICEELDSIDERMIKIGKKIISLKGDLKKYPEYRSEIIKQMKALKEKYDELKSKKLYYEQLGDSLATLENNIVGTLDSRKFEKIKQLWDRSQHIRGGITKRAMERRSWKRALAGFVWDPSQKRYEHIQKLIMNASSEDEQRKWVNIGIELTKLKLDNK